MDNNVGVRITATSDVGAGVSETKAQLGGLEGFVQTLNSTFSSMGVKMKEAFLGGAASANQMTAAVEKTAVAANTASASFGRLSERFHMGGLSMGLMERAAGPLIAAMAGVFAVDKIAEWTNKMGEAAERVSHLSQQFGLSIAQVQQLQGVATATGIPIDALTKGMGLLDRNMATAASGSKRMEQAMNAVGVSLNDGRDQMGKLEAVADKFHNMEDGPKKAALAMQLFGRSGRELIPVLNLGSAGIEQLNAKMREYGVVNEEANAKGLALAESVNESKLGFMGLENVLMDALAPSLKILVDGFNEMVAAFIQSYNSGGLVAQIFQVISGLIQELVAVVQALGEIFSAVWDVISGVITAFAQMAADVFGGSVPNSIDMSKVALNLFKDAVTIAKDIIVIDIETIGMGFRILMEVVRTFAKIAVDALTLNWGAIAGDWNRGVGNVVKIVQDGAAKIKASAAEMGAAIQAAAHGQALPGKGGGIALPKGGGNGSFDFTPSPTGSKKKGKSDKATQMDIWKQQLADMLNEEENWGVDEAQFTERFWEGKLALVKKGSKEEVEIRRTIAAQKKAIFKEEQAAEIDAIKQTESIRLDDAKTQTELQKTTLNDALDTINQRERLGQISGVRAVAERNKINLELLRLDQKEADDEFQIKRQSLQDELLLEHLKPDERRKINDEIELLTVQHNNRMLQLQSQFNAKAKSANDALVNAYVQKWQGIVGPISSALNGMFQSLYMRQASFKQAAITAMDSIVQHWAQKGIEWLSNYVATKMGMRAVDTATQTAATATQAASDAAKLAGAQTTNAGAVMSDAAVAGAGAFAATAAIPVVGPALAPGAAAAAYGAVMGMVPLAFAEGGYDIPSGSNPLTQLHQEEMVLPAHLANPLRDLLSGSFMLRTGDRGGAAGRSAGDGARTSIDNSRGDVHLHHSPSYPPPPPGVDMDTLLRSEGDRLVRFLKKAQRDGKFN